MEITRLPSDERWMAGCHDLLHAARQADQPDVPMPARRSTYRDLTDGWPGEAWEHWVAVDGDHLLGVAQLRLPQQDNVQNGWLQVTVHPERRRRGVGTALFRYGAARARELGRKRLMAETTEARPPQPSGSAGFCAKLGAVRALEEVRLRLDVAAVDQPGLDAALADARRYATGYSLVRWSEAGAPDDVVAGVATLNSDFLNQAPVGDLAFEPERIDVRRTRRIEQACRDRGWRRCHTAARHDLSGEVVAWTTLGIQGDTDEQAWQSITLVRPDHRGHRLGTLIKLENLGYARRRHPSLRFVDTCNATGNRHMMAINELMGFHPVDLNVCWQLEL